LGCPICRWSRLWVRCGRDFHSRANDVAGQSVAVEGHPFYIYKYELQQLELSELLGGCRCQNFPKFVVKIQKVEVVYPV
jgi:hypothetical protein